MDLLSVVFFGGVVDRMHAIREMFCFMRETGMASEWLAIGLGLLGSSPLSEFIKSIIFHSLYHLLSSLFLSLSPQSQICIYCLCHEARHIYNILALRPHFLSKSG